MGDVRLGIVVANPLTGARSEESTALADTGATLTVIPEDLLQRLGIRKLRAVSLVLVDGRRATDTDPSGCWLDTRVRCDE